MIKNWTPDKVKNMAKSILSSNAVEVGAFVESEARQKLDAIKSPNTKRDKNYRAYLSKWLLTNVVKTTKNMVEVSVGMKIGDRGTGTHWHGFFIETGSSTAPAHPYLRPAVFNNSKEILQLFGGKK